MAAYLGYGARPLSPGFINPSTPLVASTVAPVLTASTPSFIGGTGYGGYPTNVPPLGYARPASPSVVTTETTTVAPQLATPASVAPMLTANTSGRPASPTFYSGGPTGISGTSRIEYVPYSRKVIDYQTREWVESIPKQRVITEYKENRWMETVPRRVDTVDYYAIETVRQYVPEVIPEVTIETKPVERSVYHTEYIPIERKVTRLPPTEVLTGTSFATTQSFMPTTAVAPTVMTATVPEISVPTDISGYGGSAPMTTSVYQQPAATYTQTTTAPSYGYGSTAASNYQYGAVPYGSLGYPAGYGQTQAYPAYGTAGTGYPPQQQTFGQIPLYN